MMLALILDNKSLKAKEKMKQVGQLILDGEITVNEVIETAQSQKHVNKATLLEALEFATKSNPEILNEKGFQFAIQSLTDEAPRVKWESAKLIANTAHLFPKLIKKAVVNLLPNTEDEGTVVRWSAATALASIIQCKSQLNKELIPAIRSIMDIEEDNAIKKIYQQSLKKVSK